MASDRRRRRRNLGAPRPGRRLGLAVTGRLLATVLATAAALASIATVALATGGASTNGGGTTRAGGSEPSRAEKHRAARREAYRKSPRGRRERKASRTAYRGQSSAQAIATARAKFPELVSGGVARWPALGRRERTTGWLSSHSELVREPDGSRGIVQSSVPLVGTNAAGRRGPVDLRLVNRNGVVTPRSAPVRVDLPNRADHAIRFPDNSLSVSIDGASASGARLSSGNAFFGNVLHDTDAVVQPAFRGVQISFVLRSPDSPTRPALRFALGHGQKLVTTGGSGVPGSAAIVSRERAIANIAPPAAVDAQGKPLDVHYRVDGNRLVVDLDPSSDPAYPIAIDPTIGVYDKNGEACANQPCAANGWFWPNWTRSNSVGSSIKACSDPAFALFALCQGTGGTYTSGGALHIYGLTNYGYSGTNWAEWIKQARSNSYIYRFDAVDINHRLNNSQVSVGINCYPCAPPSAVSGSWEFGSYIDYRSGATYTGTPTHTVWSADEGGDTQYFCVDAPAGWNPDTACTPGPSAHVHDNNYAAFGLAIVGPTGPSPTPAADLGAAATYSSDRYAPTVAAPTHSTAPQPNTWVQSYSDTVGIGASDTGLGMGTLSVSGPGLDQSASGCVANGVPPGATVQSGTGASALYDNCPLSASGRWSYSAPEGIDTYNASATDIVGNRSAQPDRTWTVEVDGTEPAADTSGELDWARDEPRLTTDHPDLTVKATDENADASTTSGVRSIEVKLDGVDANPAVYKVAQTGPCDSCSLDHTFNVDTTTLVGGTHRVDVLVTDFAGNVDDQRWSFVIDRISPLPYCSNPSADPNGCQPDTPSSAPPSCSAASPTPAPPGGSVVTGDQAVSQTNASMPSAVAASDAVTEEDIAIAPAVADALPLLSYNSTGILQPSSLGGSQPTYTVGAGSESSCVAPAQVMVGAQPPQRVNQSAVEYADVSASTDAVLRPTPLGVQEIDQLRDASAPEARTFTISLASGQFLAQLSNGSVAVIDPALPRVSSSRPAPQPSPVASTAADGSEATPGFESDGISDDPAQYSTADLAGMTPPDADVVPSHTEDQYDVENSWLQEDDQQADGQEVAVVTAPWAKDATGADVPADVSVGPGPNQVTVTTHHRSAAYSYPVMASHKTLATNKNRKTAVEYGLDSFSNRGLTAVVPKNQPGAGEGAPKLESGLGMDMGRFIMTDPGACDHWDQQPGSDLTKADLNPGSPSYKDDPALQTAARRCGAAVQFVQDATAAGLKHLYITLLPANANPQGLTGKALNRYLFAYADSVDRLWKSKPFFDPATGVHVVNAWGALNEPDLNFKDPGPVAAARVWRRIQWRATHVDQDTGRPGCDGCRIVAGEFARDKPPKSGNSQDAYVTGYMNYLSQRTKHVLWAFHDYADVTYRQYHPHQPKFVELQRFVANVRRYFSKRSRIWLSEQGVVLKRHGAAIVQALWDHPDRQEEAARRFLDLAAHGKNQVQRVNYYAFFGASADWDSALVKPPDQGAAMPHPDTSSDLYPTSAPPNQPHIDFRPAYCILSRATELDPQRQTELCQNSGGE